MYKIGIIGDRESVLGFMALGFSVFEADTPAAAAARLQELVKSGELAVIFLTEALGSQMTEELARYKDMPLPAITVIPDKSGTAGYGMAALKRAAERAVGADILFKE